MGSDKDRFNIFDPIAKKTSKQTPQKQEQDERTHGSVESFEAQYTRCITQSKEIKKKIEDAFEAQHISPRDIEKYLNRPANFSAQQWEDIQKMKRELGEKLKALQDLQPKADRSEEDSSTQDVQSQKTGVPKKGLLPRKKWISMR